MGANTALSSLASPTGVERLPAPAASDSFSNIFDGVHTVGRIPETNPAPAGPASAGIVAGGCVVVVDAKPDAATSTAPADANPASQPPQILIYDPARTTTAPAAPTVPQDRPSDTVVLSQPPIRDYARPSPTVMTSGAQDTVFSAPTREATVTKRAAEADIWSNLDQIKRA